MTWYIATMLSLLPVALADIDAVWYTTSDCKGAGNAIDFPSGQYQCLLTPGGKSVLVNQIDSSGRLEEFTDGSCVQPGSEYRWLGS